MGEAGGIGGDEREVVGGAIALGGRVSSLCPPQPRLRDLASRDETNRFWLGTQTRWLDGGEVLTGKDAGTKELNSAKPLSP